MTSPKTQDEWREVERLKEVELNKPNEKDGDGWVIAGHDIENTFLRVVDKNRHVSKKSLSFAKAIVQLVDRMQGRTTVDVPTIKVTKNGSALLKFGRDNVVGFMLISEDGSAEEGTKL